MKYTKRFAIVRHNGIVSAHKCQLQEEWAKEHGTTIAK